MNAGNRKQAKPEIPARSSGLSIGFSLTIIALLIYLLVRLIGLEKYPIYFFSDEAIQAVRASDLIRDRFHNPQGELLPVFFENGGQFNLSTSVYYQVVPVLLSGRQVWVTRASTVLLTILAALALAVLVERNVRRGMGWLGVLVLSLMPAWFLHSRTAFETAMAVSFYAGFAAFYALYRQGKHGFIFPAAILAALAFYSYSPMRLVILITLAGFLISDWNYHWKWKKFFLPAVALGMMTVIPYIRFNRAHPLAAVFHLELLGSYWVQNLSLMEKISRYLMEYLRGLNPLYWYLPNKVDLPRHIMNGYGHLWQIGFPFLMIGLGWCIRNVKQWFARFVLILTLSAPVGAALVGLGITRALVMVIPAALCTVIGMVRFLEWLPTRLPNFQKYAARNTLIASLGLFLLLVLNNFYLLGDVLTNGPTWHKNYGLYGMQYGANQLFNLIKEELRDNPQTDFLLTSTWANGADILARYFFDDPLPFQMGNIDGYIREYKPIGEQTVLIMTAEEMNTMTESGKFEVLDSRMALAYPDGTPGFYFTRLKYVAGIEEIFALEKAEREKLKRESIEIQGSGMVDVEHSILDMGEILHVFDHDQATFIRTWDANPLRLVIRFKEPRRLEYLELRVGGEPTRVEVDLQPVKGKGTETLSVLLEAVADPRFVSLPVPNPETLVAALEVRVFNLNHEGPAHVQLWELRFFP